MKSASIFGSQPAVARVRAFANNSGPPRAEAATRAVLRTAFIYIIHTRQQRTAAERISDKGRSRQRSVKNRRTFSISRVQSRTCSSYAEARKRLRSELLIASKVPQASDLAKAQERPRNRFTAAAFRLPFGRAKGNVYYLGIRAAACGGSHVSIREQQRASARRGCGPHGSANCILLTRVNCR